MKEADFPARGTAPAAQMAGNTALKIRKTARFEVVAQKVPVFPDYLAKYRRLAK